MSRSTSSRRPGRLGLRRAGAAFALLLTTAGLLAGSAAPAGAHAILSRTEPADGTVLSSAPRQVSLWFTESVDLDRSTVEVVDGDGQRVPATVEAQGRGRVDSRVVVDLPDLAPNTYRVTARVQSSDDLHLSTTSVIFGLDRPVPAPARRTAPLPRAAEVALRFQGFLALAGLLGALAVNRLLRRASGPAADRAALSRRLLDLALACGVAGLACGVGLLFEQASAAGSGGGSAAWRIVGHTAYGTRWLVAQGALAALVLVVTRLRTSARRELPLAATGRMRAGAVIVPLASVVGVAQTLLGHAAASATVSPGRVAVSALHGLAAAVLVGSLLALAFTAVPALRRGGHQAPIFRQVLARFWTVAAPALGLLVITGLLLAAEQAASLDAVVLTLYGRVLVAKVAMVVVLAGLGLLNHLRLHPESGGRIRRRGPAPARPVGRTVALEAAAAAVVVFLASVLMSSQPARGPEFAPAPKALAADPVVSSAADDLVVTASVKPNRPGRNFVSLGVFDTRRPTPAPIGSVAVVLRRPTGGEPITVPATPIGQGRYEAVSDRMALPGPWTITVLVSREGLPDAPATMPWTMGNLPRPPGSVVLSDRPLAPVLNRTAAGLTAAFLAVVFVAVRRRKASHDPQAATGTPPGIRPPRTRLAPGPSPAPGVGAGPAERTGSRASSGSPTPRPPRPASRGAAPRRPSRPTPRRS